MIRHGSSARDRYHGLVRHFAVGGERIDERPVAVRVIPVQIDIVDGSFERG